MQKDCRAKRQLFESLEIAIETKIKTLLDLSNRMLEGTTYNMEEFTRIKNF